MRTKGLEADDGDSQPMRPPARRTSSHTVSTATSMVAVASVEPQAPEQAPPPILPAVHRMAPNININNNNNNNNNQRRSSSSRMDPEQFRVKAFMAAIGSTRTNGNDHIYNETTPPPGAVAVDGIHSQTFSGIAPANEWDNVGESSVRVDDDDEYDNDNDNDNDNNNDNAQDAQDAHNENDHDSRSPIVAQLAPDDDDVAARVAERLERQMREEWTERLKREVEAQLSTHRQSHALAEAVTIPHPPPATTTTTNTTTTTTNGNNCNGTGDVEAPSNTTTTASTTTATATTTTPNTSESIPGDNFKVCGLRRRCWGILLIVWMPLMVGAAVGVILYMNSQSSNNSNGNSSKDSSQPQPQPTPPPQNDTTRPSAATPTPSPTFAPTSRSNTVNWDYLVQEILWSMIVEETTEVSQSYLALLDDDTTPQAQALQWLSTEDDWAATPQTIPDQWLIERYALAVLYYSTTQEGSSSNTKWTNDLSFLEPTSVCDWNTNTNTNVGVNNDESAQGVYCDNASSSVQTLHMAALGLTGVVPWELSWLTHLVRLDMESNGLRGTLPTELARLTTMETLSFNSNALTGPLPPTLPSSLQSLDLNDNGFTGTLPAAWGSSSTGSRLSELYYVGLGLNDIDGGLPAAWQGLPKLRFLDLEDNVIEGSLPTQYGVLMDLESLYLEKNQLEGALPSELGQLVGLKQLLVYNNQRLTGSLPQDYQGLTHLENLWIQGTNLTGSVDNVFCSSSSATWAVVPDLKANCRGDPPQIACACCSSCCTAAGDECVAN